MPSPDPVINAKRSATTSALMVGGHLLFALLPVYVACILGAGWWLAPLCVWFGAGMNSVLNLMHECAHYHVFRSKRACTFLGRWIIGPMALADFEAYRERHWEHHRSLGTDADPKYVYHTPIRGWRLPLLALKCLVFYEPARRFTMNFRRSTSAKDQPLNKTWMGRTLLFHSLLVSTLAGVALIRSIPPAQAVAEAAFAYAVVYLYGLAAVTVFFASLRGIAEHQIGGDDAPHQNNAALRNFRVNPMTRWLFGAYGFADHYTHHLKPSLPHYLLPRTTRELSAKNPSLQPTHSYLGTLRNLTLAPRPDKPGT